MAAIVPIGLATLLGLLAALHVYWAAGGGRGLRAAVPEVGGSAVFRPSRLASLGVATGLVGAALVALSRGGLVVPADGGSLAHWAAISLSLAFFIRALGDFRLVGFTKRIRGTQFAEWDDRLFSPLCLLMGFGFLFVATR